MTKLLFVCTVNRHRSVIAEYLFKRLLDDAVAGSGVDASSAGVVTKAQKEGVLAQGVAVPEPLFGYRPMPCVILHMQKRGIDVSEHRSRPLTATMAAEASLIVAMGESHRKNILAEFPDTNGRVFALAELSHPFEFEDIAASEPPGFMPPADFCLRECDHWGITAAMLGEAETRLAEAAPVILHKLGI